MTLDPEVLGAFSADDPLEARVGKVWVMLGRVSRESEISLGEKTLLRGKVPISRCGPHILKAKASKGGE